MGFDTITTIREGPVLKAVINDGKINILHWRIMSDLNDLFDSIQDDDELKVLIFSSSNPDFFIAHLDLVPRAGVYITVLKNLSLMDDEYRLHPVLEATMAVSKKLFSQSTLPVMHPNYPSLGYFFGLMYRIRTLPLCTIALISGRCRGAGNDFATACDMRFGTTSAIIGAPEISAGLFAAGGAARRMVEIMGSGRAAEYLFTGKDIDAETAERTGLLNKVFESEREMDEFVGDLAKRVGRFNGEAVRLNKASLVDRKVSLKEYETDFVAAMGLLERPETRQRMKEAMQLVKGGIHCQEELDLGEALAGLYD